MIRKTILTLVLLSALTVVAAQWAYITPPWDFDVHPKYAGKDFQSIPVIEWEQLAAFDSATKCEEARLFAREIRNLSPSDRERLLALFASGAEDRARREAELPIAQDLGLKRVLRDSEMILKSESRTLKWWSASRCVPLR